MDRYNFKNVDPGNSLSTYNTGNDIHVDSISAQLDMDDRNGLIPAGPGPAVFYDETTRTSTTTQPHHLSSIESNMYNSLAYPRPELPHVHRPLPEPPVPLPVSYPLPLPAPYQQPGMVPVIDISGTPRGHPPPMLPGYMPGRIPSEKMASNEKLVKDEERERRRRKRRRKKRGPRELENGCSLGTILLVVAASVLILGAIIAVVILTRV